MRSFHERKHVIQPWRLVTKWFSGSPAGWLPQPLSMSGSHDFKGELHMLGVGVEVEYLVSDPWLDGSEMSRRIEIVPRYDLFAGVHGDLVVEAAPGRSCMVSFVGQRTPSGPRMARLLDPVTSRLLAVRFFDGAVDRLEEPVDHDRTVVWPGDAVE